MERGEGSVATSAYSVKCVKNPTNGRFVASCDGFATRARDPKREPVEYLIFSDCSADSQINGICSIPGQDLLAVTRETHATDVWNSTKFSLRCPAHFR